MKIKNMLLALLMLMGVSPLSAMKRQPDDQLREDVKSQRTDEVLEEKIELEVKPESKVDWDDVEDLMGQGIIFETIIEKHGYHMTKESNDFEKLLALSLCYNGSLGGRIQVVVDLIIKRGPAILKYMIFADEGNNLKLLESSLKSGKAVVLPLHLACAVALENVELLNLLLKYATFDLNVPLYYGQYLGEFILRQVTPDEQMSLFFDVCLSRGYKLVYEDLAATLDMENVEAFQYLLDHVKSDRFQEVFYAPTGYSNENLLYEILKSSLDVDYVAYLMMKDNVPQCDFRKMAIFLFSNYSLDGNLTQEGQEILGILCDYFKINSGKYDLIVMPFKTMMNYIVKNDVVKCQELLLEGENPNESFGNYSSYLIKAISCKSLDCIRVLLAHGANIKSHACVLDSDWYNGYSETIKNEIKYARAVQFLNEWQVNEVQISQLPVQKFLEKNDDFSEGRTGESLEGFYVDVANGEYSPLTFLNEGSDDKQHSMKFILCYPKVAEQFIFPTMYRWFSPTVQKRIFGKNINQQDVIKDVSDQEWLEHELNQNAQKIDKQGERNKNAQKLYVWFVMGEKLKHITNQSIATTRFTFK